MLIVHNMMHLLVLLDVCGVVGWACVRVWCLWGYVSSMEVGGVHASWIVTWLSVGTPVPHAPPSSLR